MDKLGRDEAVWLLAKINARDLHMEELQGNISIRIEARVSHVTSIPPSTHGLVVYKLTPETVKSLVHCCEAVLHQGEKCQLVFKLKDFCYEPGFNALGRLQKDGGDELGCNESEKVKHRLMRILPHPMPCLSFPMGPVTASAALGDLLPAPPIIPVFYPLLSEATRALPSSESLCTGNKVCWPSSIIDHNLVRMGECLQAPSSSLYAPDVGTPIILALLDGTGTAQWQWPQFLDVLADEGCGK